MSAVHLLAWSNGAKGECGTKVTRAREIPKGEPLQGVDIFRIDEVTCPECMETETYKKIKALPKEGTLARLELECTVTPITVAGIEDRELTVVDGKSILFGHINDQWEELKAKEQPGDRWVEFNSSEADWVMLMGRHGYALIRGDQVVGSIVDMMS